MEFSCEALPHGFPSTSTLAWTFDYVTATANRASANAVAVATPKCSGNMLEDGVEKTTAVCVEPRALAWLSQSDEQP